MHLTFCWVMLITEYLARPQRVVTSPACVQECLDAQSYGLGRTLIVGAHLDQQSLCSRMCTQNGCDPG